MVALTIRHGVQWQAPMPLWAENSSTGIRISNEALAPYPSILRFATDTFMQDMLDVMNENPQRISEWLVQPETWREPMENPKLTPKNTTESGLSFLLNKTKKVTDQYRPGAKKRSSRSRKSVVIADKARDDAIPIKLFQSSHKRFYLVSASLISSEPGYPDQALDLSSREKATFIVRRLMPPDDKIVDENQAIDNIDDWDEYALVASNGGSKWQRIDQSKSLACKKLLDQEEQLPLFPVNYKDSCTQNRTVLSGLVPVGNREKWMAAPITNAIAGVDQDDENDLDVGMSHARIMFQTDVTAPWKILVEQAEFKKDSLTRGLGDRFDTSGSAAGENENARRAHRDNIQMASWYVLLDFAKFLERYLPGSWSVAKQLSANASLSVSDFDLDENEGLLLSIIQQTRLHEDIIGALVALDDQYLTYPPRNPSLDPLSYSILRRQAAINAKTVKVSLLDALIAVRDLESNLESVENAFVRFDDQLNVMVVDDKWPKFLFPLADPEFNGPIPDNQANSKDLEDKLNKIDALAELIGKILPETSKNPEFTSSQNTQSQRDAWFVIRCVYERPCCGPLFPALVSEPTRLFQMAPFFDPDAPARPIRIPMPMDISPAGLRKFQKNTSFVISDMLCGKIKKIRKMTLGDLVLSVLPWPFHKDLPDPSKTGPCQKGPDKIGFGMLCSLSIPIVTLCALILLWIMVALFDLFFRWIPFLFTCLPIPKFTGKKKS